MIYNATELMTVAAARTLTDATNVFVGIGMPNLAANLAKRLYVPDLTLIYEAGVIGSVPIRLPISIGDPCLVTGSLAVCSFHSIFAYYLQRGLIDVGFLGGAQIDKYGNINSTVIGDYHDPKIRMSGSGGGCEIAAMAKRILIIIPQNKRRFLERVDFITSPGFLGGRAEREKLNLVGNGPEKVITDLGILEFDETGEMILTHLHPEITVEQAKENTGWDLKIAPDLKETLPPTGDELKILREVLDPQRIYISGAKE